MAASAFKARYMIFNETEDSIINIHLEECKTLLNEKAYGSKYQQSLFLLVAHELHLEQNPSTVNVVTNRSNEAGSVAIKNVSTTEKELYYSSTIYGKKYLTIRSSIRVVGYVLNDLNV